MKGLSRMAVVILGAPGSGKGTQASLLAKKLRLFHFDTGRHLDNLFYRPSSAGDKVLRKLRPFFEGGFLLPSDWILGVIKGEIKRLARAGLGVVLSGSPRTYSEAFGNGRNGGLFGFLKKLYGSEKVFAVFLKVSAKTAVKRNSARFVCAVCESPLIDGGRFKNCPFCGGALRKRVFDNSRGMKVRLKEYRRLTLPIVKELKKRRWPLIEVIGAGRPYAVNRRIYDRVKNASGN